MEIYREVCNALERLYERSSETGSEPSPLRAQSQPAPDGMMTLSPADANYQVCNEGSKEMIKLLFAVSAHKVWFHCDFGGSVHIIMWLEKITHPF